MRHQKKLEKLESLEKVPALHRRAKAKPLEYYEKKHKDQELVITAAYLTGDYTMREIGDHYEKHYSTISRIIKRCE